MSMCNDYDFSDSEYLEEPVYPYPDQEDGEEGRTLGEAAGISHRLMWQFKVYDILHPHDLTSLNWEVEGFIRNDWDRSTKAGRKRRPPPPADPRTRLPEIFDFRGWNYRDIAHFDLLQDHPPCYPLELVGRLKGLHESGVGGQREDAVVYLVVEETLEGYFGKAGFGSDGESRVQIGTGAEDDSASGSEGDAVVEKAAHEPGVAYIGKTEASDNGPRVITEFFICDAGDGCKELRRVGTYETLERANDAAMSLFEKDYRGHLLYQNGPHTDGMTCPADLFLGLYRIVPEGQETQLLASEWNRIEEDDKDGATWRLDDYGCLRLTGYCDNTTVSTFTVTRHTVPQGFSEEEVISKYFKLLAQGEKTNQHGEKAKRNFLHGMKHLEKAMKYSDKVMKHVRKAMDHGEQAQQHAKLADRLTPGPSLPRATGEDAKAESANGSKIVEAIPKEHEAPSPSTSKGTKRAMIYNESGKQHAKKKRRRKVTKGFR